MGQSLLHCRARPGAAGTGAAAGVRTRPAPVLITRGERAGTVCGHGPPPRICVGSCASLPVDGAGERRSFLTISAVRSRCDSMSPLVTRRRADRSCVSNDTRELPRSPCGPRARTSDPPGPPRRELKGHQRPLGRGRGRLPPAGGRVAVSSTGAFMGTKACVRADLREEDSSAGRRDHAVPVRCPGNAGRPCAARHHERDAPPSPATSVTRIRPRPQPVVCSPVSDRARTRRSYMSRSLCAARRERTSCPPK